MKTAIYIEDGVYQLVITPETKFEQSALQTMQERSIDAEIYSGGFYHCQGGWVRQRSFGPYQPNPYGGGCDETSLIIKVNKSEEK